MVILSVCHLADQAFHASSWSSVKHLTLSTQVGLNKDLTRKIVCCCNFFFNSCYLATRVKIKRNRARMRRFRSRVTQTLGTRLTATQTAITVDAYKHSFYVRSIPVWNTSADVVSSSSYPEFIRRVSTILI